MPTPRTLFLALPIATLPFIAAACGSSSAGITSSNDASTMDAASLVPSGAVVDYKVEGGFFAQRNDGGVCQIWDEDYSFDTTSGLFTWTVCVFDDAGAGNFRTGQITLSGSDLADVQSLLASITATGLHCATDVQTEILQINAPGTPTQLYYAGGDGCPGGPGSSLGKGFTNGDALLTEFIELAGLQGLQGTSVD